MKLLAELLQEKLGENEKKAFVKIDEYMEYANKHNKKYENANDAWSVLGDELEELLNCKVTTGVPYETMLFAKFNIVTHEAITPLVFLIEFSDYTFTLRKQSTNWLLDCLKENSNEHN